MKTILICPEHRPASAAFHSMLPLALMPVLGRTLIELHLLDLAANGAKKVLILAADRPEMIRRAVGNGAAWGLEIELIPTRMEMTPEDAVVHYGGKRRCTVRIIDTLPDGSPLWPSTAETFNILTSQLDRQNMAGSLTMREVKPQVWISTKARMADGVVVNGPIWIGPHATVRKGAKIGPRTVIEAHAFVDELATIRESWIGPATYLGAATDVSKALIWGRTITHWDDGSQFEPNDSMMLADLSAKKPKPTSWTERAAALLLMMIAFPAALIAMLRCHLRKVPALTPRTVMTDRGTQVLCSLTGSDGLLRRWPELRAVVRGELALVGNRPLTPMAATALRGEMGQLWFSAPTGVLSLADAEGDDGDSPTESITHSAYFAAQRSLRLRASILARCLVQSFSINNNDITSNPAHEH